MKLEKMKRNRAGRYIPREFADEIVGTLEDYDLEPEFIEGAACVLSYLTAPKAATCTEPSSPSTWTTASSPWRQSLPLR